MTCGKCGCSYLCINSGPCVCDEETALEMRGISSTPSNHNTVMVFLHVGLQNSKECICCPNLTLAYRYCAWSNGYAVPKNISAPESTHALPWSPWIPDNPLCLRRPLTISIANLSSNHYYRFQVAPLSTGLGPITKLKYFGSQGMIPAPLQLNTLVGVAFWMCVMSQLLQHEDDLCLQLILSSLPCSNSYDSQNSLKESASQWQLFNHMWCLWFTYAWGILD